MSRRTAWVTAVAAGVVLLCYARTLWFDFYWDDFDVFRPWSWHDLGRALTGDYRPWATEGIPFYRPLTSLYYAALSTAFGLDARPMHVVPLVTITAAATLTGLYVARLTARTDAGVAVAALYAVHPITAAAIGPWIANQYQGFLVIALLASLHLSHGRALDQPRAWLRLLPCLVAAAWLKEDGVMLAPALVAVAWTTHWVAPATRRPAPRAWALAAGIALAFVAWRTLWIGPAAGYGVPDPASIVANLQRAARYLLLWQADAYPPAWPLRLLKWALLVAAAGAVWRARGHAATGAAQVVAAGLAILLVMNLPLGMVSSENRWHAVGLGAVLIIGGALIQWHGRRLAAVTVVVVALFGLDTWRRIDAFAPCAADTRSHDAWVAGLDDLPVELRQWVRLRDAACAAGRFQRFSVPMRDLRWTARTPSATSSAADAPR